MEPLELLKDFPKIAFTALVAGILVPLIKALMDDRYFRKQKEFERVIRLQEHLIDMRVSFIDSLTEKLWKFYFCAIRFTYYASSNNRLNKKEFEVYEDGAWRAIAEVREASSPGSYLLPQKEFKAIVIQIINEIVDLDADLSDSYESQRIGKKVKWMKFHKRVNEFAVTITRANRDLARALQIDVESLTASTAESSPPATQSSVSSPPSA